MITERDVAARLMEAKALLDEANAANRRLFAATVGLTLSSAFMLVAFVVVVVR